MNFLKLILTILIFFNINSCGFTPIYNYSNQGSQTIYEEKLAQIEIVEKRKRINQKLRENLLKVINPKDLEVDKKYLLDIDLQENISGTFINPTGSAGRNKVTLIANYKLIRIEDEEIIATGLASANDDFNVEDKRFANYIIEEEIGLNLTKLVVVKIRNLLINDLILEDSEKNIEN